MHTYTCIRTYINKYTWMYVRPKTRMVMWVDMWLGFHQYFSPFTDLCWTPELSCDSSISQPRPGNSEKVRKEIGLRSMYQLTLVQFPLNPIVTKSGNKSDRFRVTVVNTDESPIALPFLRSYHARRRSNYNHFTEHPDSPLSPWKNNSRNYRRHTV